MNENLFQTSLEVLDAECVPEEIRSARDVVYEILEIGKRLSNRWDKRQEYDRWVANGRVGDEPTFVDADTQEVRSSRYALSPCRLVNTQLDDLISIVLRWYSSEKLNNVMNMLTRCDATAQQIAELRQLCIHAEEAMEEEAIELTFQVVEKNPLTYKEMVKKTGKSLYMENPNNDDDNSLNQLRLIDEVTYRFLVYMKRSNTTQTELLCTQQKERLALLHALVVDVPDYMQRLDPFLYKGMVFKYFCNYLSLVIGELQLLTMPMVLHKKSKNGGKCFVAPACELPDLICSLQCYTKVPGYENCKSGCKEPVVLISGTDLSSKTFTFVGAGFPLTGVVLHILTGGAKINLVDCDPHAVNNAIKFVKIAESLDIVAVGAINAINAYAENCYYEPTTQRVKSSLKKGSTKAAKQTRDVIMSGRTAIPGDVLHEDHRRIRVPTDILDIASAIPQDVTRQLLNDNAAVVPVVRKRNTRGMSEILYEKFELESEPCRFQLVAEVSPPQSVVSGASPEYLIAGLVSSKNLNSCQLYLNSEMTNVNNDMGFHECT